MTLKGSTYTVINGLFSESEFRTVHRLFHEELHNPLLISNISILECISTYSTNYLSGRGHVVAITNERGSSNNETLFYAAYAYDLHAYHWMSFGDDEERYPHGHSGKAQDWLVNGKKIEYCLSQLQPQHCTVQFSVHILVAVIIINALKSFAMFVTVYGQRDPTLVTVGDAIASYLDKPDDYSVGRCLIDRKDTKMWRHGANNPFLRVYKDSTGSRWFSATGKIKWITCLFLISATIAASGFLVGMGASSAKDVDISPWNLGWGAVDPNTIISGSDSLPEEGVRGLVVSVMLANCPQALASFLYLLYNSMLTSLLLAKEWSTYASQRKALRVSTRNGSHQRSTYYLHLPFRYSIPLLCVSVMVHWTISQGIFLVRIYVYYMGETLGDVDTNIGFSLPPILTAKILGFIMVAFLIGLGFRRLGDMPVAGSCSVAISAACHRPEDDVVAALLPIQWGAVQGTEEGIGHACFTSQPVALLVPGRVYA